MKTNTKIYTAEFVQKELEGMLNELKGNEDIIYIGELFLNKDYSRSRFHEWVEEYKDNDEITRISCTIKEILEVRAVKGAMNNKLNSTVTIFHLKNNYKWVDKQEIDQKTEHTINNLSDASNEDLLKMIK